MSEYELPLSEECGWCHGEGCIYRNSCGIKTQYYCHNQYWFKEECEFCGGSGRIYLPELELDLEKK